MISRVATAASWIARTRPALPLLPALCGAFAAAAAVAATVATASAAAIAAAITAALTVYAVGAEERVQIVPSQRAQRTLLAQPPHPFSVDETLPRRSGVVCCRVARCQQSLHLAVAVLHSPTVVVVVLVFTAAVVIVHSSCTVLAARCKPLELCLRGVWLAPACQL